MAVACRKRGATTKCFKHEVALPPEEAAAARSVLPPALKKTTQGLRVCRMRMEEVEKKVQSL
jgi:hypothetical protein